MEKIISLAFALAISFFGIFSAAKHFWRGETLSTDNVCKRWGEKKWDETKFKTDNADIKAEMACDIMRNGNKFQKSLFIKTALTINLRKTKCLRP